MSSTGWCFLFDIIHSVEREVSCKSQVLFIAFFLYNGIVDYWLFTCPPVHLSRRGVMDICNLEFRLKSLNFIDHWSSDDSDQTGRMPRLN